MAVGERITIQSDCKKKKLNTPSKHEEHDAQNQQSDDKNAKRNSSNYAEKNDQMESQEDNPMPLSEFDELHFLLPAVIRTLKSAGQLDTYIKFNELLAGNRQPLDNICYLLFLDLIEWFSAESHNISRMRYKYPQTIQFWEVGMRLFHGKFIRFMSGLRNTGQVINQMSEKGYYDPSTSKINFAVPSQTT